MKESVYTNNGYEDREDYLENLADNYGVPPMVIYEIADLLGENEDFDGLVSSLEDFADIGLLDWE